MFEKFYPNNHFFLTNPKLAVEWIYSKDIFDECEIFFRDLATHTIGKTFQDFEKDLYEIFRSKVSNQNEISKALSTDKDLDGNGKDKKNDKKPTLQQVKSKKSPTKKLSVQDTAILESQRQESRLKAELFALLSALQTNLNPKQAFIQNSKQNDLIFAIPIIDISQSHPQIESINLVFNDKTLVINN